MNERLGKIVLHVEGLSKVYGEGPTRLEALKPTTFDAVAGEVVAILGPSGSGKSTLLTIIGLINPPTTGSLMINGDDVIKNGQEVVNLTTVRRQQLGYVFQRSNLIPFLNGEENVRLALEIDGVPARESRDRARALLDSLGMGGRMKAMPSKLSGGEQQRVAIARAMIHQPSIVLADEPTAALDSSRGRQVMELFRDSAHANGAAVLVVTHDHRTLDLVDRVLEMEDGVLAEKGHTANTRQ
ncbi:MAG: ABC transporter ATP-binding protein [Planctomycetes bacterium]|nr:ABC transporter ATP-binding protein [Planctomycetota bacterium]